MPRIFISIGLGIVITILTIGVFAFWAYVLKRRNELRAYEYPSRSVEHSIEKGVFIDSVEILSRDTIIGNRSASTRDPLDGEVVEQIRVYAESAWIEKVIYWKSGVVNRDSVGFRPDVVSVVINFSAFMNGAPYTPGYGHYALPLFDLSDHEELIYFDDETARVNFFLTPAQATDSIRLKTKDGQQLLLKPRE